jgi:hypothetical protein
MKNNNKIGSSTTGMNKLVSLSLIDKNHGHFLVFFIQYAWNY